VELATRNYWWPGVTRNMGKYVERCDLYQRMKNRMEELAVKQGTEETMVASNSRFYNEATGSGREECDIGSM